MDQNQENYIASLQQELDRRNKDIEAMRQELSSTGGAETEKPATIVKNALMPNVPTFIENIIILATAADSESVRLQANKLLTEWAVTNKLITGDESTDQEFKNLLQSLRNKTKVKE